MREAGRVESDLAFSLDHEAGRRFGLLPNSSDRGLLFLAQAVVCGASRLVVSGTNVRCGVSYRDVSVVLGHGGLKTLVQRGSLAPLELLVNDLRVFTACRPGLVEVPLLPEGALLGGRLTLLPRHQKGQVVLLDRGVSFQLGPLLGATRALVRVSPRRGAPWPSRLLMDDSTREILRSLVRQCRALEARCFSRHPSR